MSHATPVDTRVPSGNPAGCEQRGSVRAVGTIAADIADLEAERDRLPADCEIRALFDIAIQPLREHVDAIRQRFLAVPLGG